MENDPNNAPAADPAPATDPAPETKSETWLEEIEADAKALLKKIEAIPAGITHGLHSLGHEIASRFK